ncbi:hypothetical protein KP509_26G040800 [Ceratopteris richardii]|uniref:Uncharacterized protein n=1 Tax=Ceratopteris richardii TaxID=49495 RepID=A0A8T2RLB5_CERRI|nr:hypothetical protein KP509_26G040800 [Ceratopteris richardii]
MTVKSEKEETEKRGGLWSFWFFCCLVCSRQEGGVSWFFCLLLEGHPVKGGCSLYFRGGAHPQEERRSGGLERKKGGCIVCREPCNCRHRRQKPMRRRMFDGDWRRYVEMMSS